VVKLAAWAARFREQAWGPLAALGNIPTKRGTTRPPCPKGAYGPDGPREPCHTNSQAMTLARKRKKHSPQFASSRLRKQTPPKTPPPTQKDTGLKRVRKDFLAANARPDASIGAKLRTEQMREQKHPTSRFCSRVVEAAVDPQPDRVPTGNTIDGTVVREKLALTARQIKRRAKGKPCRAIRI